MQMILEKHATIVILATLVTLAILGKFEIVEILVIREIQGTIATLATLANCETLEIPGRPATLEKVVIRLSLHIRRHCRNLDTLQITFLLGLIILRSSLDSRLSKAIPLALRIPKVTHPRIAASLQVPALAMILAMDLPLAIHQTLDAQVCAMILTISTTIRRVTTHRKVIMASLEVILEVHLREINEQHLAFLRMSPRPRMLPWVAFLLMILTITRHLQCRLVPVFLRLEVPL